jgi:uncharacterized membrane protein (DUF4010 family)
MQTEILKQLAVSLGLGLLVGFQREWSPNKEAGIRTFALITVFGTVCAQLAGSYGGWVIAAGLIAVAATVLMGQFMGLRTGEDDIGITTEIAALVMYGVGAILVMGQVTVAVIVGGTVAVLLHWKTSLHRFVRRIEKKDISAIMQLILIGLVILPILPNRTYGPYNVLNPHDIWLMVVLIVGISLGSYLAYRFLSARAGMLLSGLFGGLISSTATTVTHSRRTRGSSETVNMSTVIIMVASTMVFGRVAFEVFLVAPSVMPRIILPLLVLMGYMVIISGGFYLFLGRRQKKVRLDENPSQLKTAVVFGLLYAIVILAVTAAKEHLGQTGLYAVSALSGLTDADAITLSTAQLMKAGKVNADTGWRMIMIGALSNVVFKGGIVALLGARRLLKHIAVAFGLTLAGGLAILWLWPGV